MATEGALRMWIGMVFHFKGAATEKALSQYIYNKYQNYKVEMYLEVLQ